MIYCLTAAVYVDFMTLDISYVVRDLGIIKGKHYFHILCKCGRGHDHYSVVDLWGRQEKWIKRIEEQHEDSIIPSRTSKFANTI